MANQALQNLQALESTNQKAQNQAEAQAQFARDEASTDAVDFSATDGKKASFSTPEAIATAVVGSLILGPVGGVALGVAQGWLGKQAKQNILDQQAARNEQLNDSRTVITDEISSLESNAQTKQESDQAGMLRAGADLAFEEMLSADPSTQARGAARLDEINTEMLTMAETQSQWARDDKVTRATIEREDGIAARQAYDGIYDDFRADTANLVDQDYLINNTLELVENGSPQALYASVVTMTKVFDPTSIVTGGERGAAAGFNAEIGNMLSGFVDKYKDGEIYTEEDRRDIAKTALLMRGQVDSQFQIAQARSIDRMDDVGFEDSRYYDDFDQDRWLGSNRYMPNPAFLMEPETKKKIIEAAEANQGGGVLESTGRAIDTAIGEAGTQAPTNTRQRRRNRGGINQ